MRRLSILVGLITLTLGLITPARAATPGALTPAQASAACEAFFGVAAGPEPLSACQWDMRTIEAGRGFVRERHRQRRDGRRDRRRRRPHPSRPRRQPRRRPVVLVHLRDTPTADPKRSPTATARTRRRSRTFRATAPMSQRRSPGRSTVSASPAWRPMPRSSRSRPARSSASASPTRSPRRSRYAGDQRLDVVNLSLFADPFLYYCHNDAEQRAMLKTAVERCEYAQQRGVVIVAAAGNEAHDLGHPEYRRHQPRLAAGHRRGASVNNACRRRTGGASRRDHRLGHGRQRARQLLERRCTGRCHRSRWRRRADAGHDLRPDPRRLVQHRRDREVGGLAAPAAGSRMPRRPLGVDQRHVDGFAARRRRGRPDPEVHPGWSPSAVAAAVRRSAEPVACPTDWPATTRATAQGDRRAPPSTARGW